MDHGRVTSVAELLQDSDPKEGVVREQSSESERQHAQEVNENDASIAAAISALSATTGTKKRRRRVPVSCNVCRYRKLKCDRQHPCGSCRNLKMESICQYESRFPPNIPNPSSLQKGGKVQKDNTPVLEESDDVLKSRLAWVEKELSEVRNLKGISIPVAENQEIKAINNVYRPTVLQGQRFIPPSTAEGVKANDSDGIREFRKAVDARVAETLAKYPSQKDYTDDSHTAIWTSLKTAGPERKWNSLLELLPSAKTSDVLQEHFNSSINSFFHALDSEALGPIVSHVRDLYLDYHLKGSHQVSLTISDVHQIGLVLVTCGLARLTLSKTWSVRSDEKSQTEEIPNPSADFFALLTEILRQTDISRDSSLISVQLAYYLCVYYNFFITGPTDTSVLGILVQSAYAIGLHRDPNMLIIDDQSFDSGTWRQMWRQVVFMDTVQSLDLGLPPLINLRYADCDLETFPSTENVSHDYLKGLNSEKAIIKWTMLCREVQDKILFVPFSSISQRVIGQLDQVLASYTFKNEAPDEESGYALHGIIQLYLGYLRVKYAQVAKSEDKFELIRHSVHLLQLQLHHCVENNSDYKYLLTSLGIKLCRHAWTSLVRALLDPEVLSRGAGEGIKFLDLVRNITVSHEWVYTTIMSYDPTSSFESWKTYLVEMDAMLTTLKDKIPDGKKSKILFKRVESPPDPS
ncbi:hypothetical protein TRICI_004140 [Trichomonascus ciferrii]|uniref:Zn(2)-C6 fungal-type domain-containing protein n=1 Tax=Trichomonascus ciferrii TaxID=44093 RepID=A0A642V1P9_9ASCO|nr:hypothetical protein TRICI_004140 [Trichomonascus ciferrii]